MTDWTPERHAALKKHAESYRDYRGDMAVNPALVLDLLAAYEAEKAAERGE